jgi:phenylacetate-coenzyme A ligase PaaK-like adenylate-forming protein
MTNTLLLDPAAVQRHAAELIARDKSPRRELLEIQRQRLAGLLRHAASASPFYRETIGRRIESGASLEDLPALTKRTLMDQWDRIVTDPHVRLREVEAHLAGERRAELFGGYRAFATGGTTGERAVVIYDHEAWLWTVANMMRWVNTLGVGPSTRVLGIGAPTPLHITNRAFAELQGGQSDAPRLSVLTPLPELVARLNDFQPEMIITYPSFVRRLAEEQDAGRLRMRPDCIASTAEVLTSDVRALAKKAWGARVIDSYGTTEGGLLGTECDATTGIHIAEDVVVYEVVDQAGRRVPEGTPGSRILLTNLLNRVLPLIRYEISDIATVVSAPCPCGRPYARVTAIDGRREDYMTLRALDGGAIRIHAGRLRAPLAGVPGLRQFQVATGAERITLRLSVRDDADPEAVRRSVAELARSVLRNMGADVTVSVELIDALERAGTGAKEKLVV